MIPEYYEFSNTVKVLSGRLALENIPAELRALGAMRPMLLTDAMLVKLGIAHKVVRAFAETEMEIGVVYSDIPADSSVEVVNAIAAEYLRSGCDSLVAVGGGSVIDTAKGLSIIISAGASDLMDYMGVDVLGPRKVPFIVVPTTAGTGSEATSVAVIADTQKNVKMEFVSGSLLPDVAVLDARMTLSLPARLTASTGMDTLSHAVEAYTCLQRNPVSSVFAATAIELIRDNLLKAVTCGADEDARLAMANASTLAGMAFSNSMVGIVHAIGHSLGGVAKVPHGDAMSILLPHCMEFNMKKVGALYGELLMHLAGAAVFASTKPSERPAKAVEAVRELAKSLAGVSGLPTRLSETRVTREQFGAVARAAVNDGAMIVNPVHADENDVIAILERAF